MPCRSDLLTAILVALSCCVPALPATAGRVLQLVDRSDVKAFSFPFTDRHAGVLLAMDVAGQPRKFLLVEAQGRAAEIPVEVQDQIFETEGYRQAGDETWRSQARLTNDPAILSDGGHRVSTLQAWPAVVAGVPPLEETWSRLRNTVKDYAGRPVQKIILTAEGAVILSAPPQALKHMVAVDRRLRRRLGQCTRQQWFCHCLQPSVWHQPDRVGDVVVLTEGVQRRDGKARVRSHLDRGRPASAAAGRERAV